MIQTRQIGSHTEIYIDQNGGGDISETQYITQSKNTVFHDFWTRKFLGAGESMDDFKLVTAAERAQLQAIRDAWTRPPQVFIDMWNTAAGAHGRYNEDTGYFELNGLTNITYEQAVLIYNVTHSAPTVRQCNGTRIRTNLLNRRVGYGSGSQDDRMPTGVFHECWYLEVARINIDKDAPTWMTRWSNMFSGCSNLREIIGVIGDEGWRNKATPFYRCYKLEKFKITRLNGDIDLTGNPLLNSESYLYTIEHREMVTGKTITITVHPDVYAKLTDTENAEWSAVLTAAAEKNITFVSATT